jgi:hypothetical protein
MFGLSDTAATGHTALHGSRTSYGKLATSKDSITVGNGAKEQALKISNTIGTMCDNYGNELDVTKLPDVTHLPSGKFDLFSLMNMQKQGWLLHGNKKKIWLMKDSQMVTFDMVIPTNKGLLFTLYFKRGTEIAGAIPNLKPQQMSVDEVHNKFDHSHENSTHKITAEIGIELI